MPNFEFTITAPGRTEKLAAITWARETIKARLPPKERFATDADYVTHVMDKAAESYAKAAGYIENAP
jgi:hypothetical protein